ncbi:hypothetical protein MVEG_10609 [Podila verticillata NRRL 6337]|nr:hypothetical protein MVEG_10609 [Podila verticillata NRRL 6337]
MQSFRSSELHTPQKRPRLHNSFQTLPPFSSFIRPVQVTATISESTAAQSNPVSPLLQQTEHLYSVDSSQSTSDGYNSGHDPAIESDTSEIVQVDENGPNDSSSSDENDSDSSEAEEDPGPEGNGKTGHAPESDLASDPETLSSPSARKARLKAQRQESLEKFAKTWQDIIERYSLKAASGRPDFEIDLATGEVHDEHGVSSFNDRRTYARMAQRIGIASKSLGPSLDSSFDTRSNLSPSNDSLGEYDDSELSCQESDTSIQYEQETGQSSDGSLLQDDKTGSEGEGKSKHLKADIEDEEEELMSTRQAHENSCLLRESVRTSDSEHTTHTRSPSPHLYQLKLVTSSRDELDDFTSRVSGRLEYEPQGGQAWPPTLDTKLNIDFSLLWPSERPQADVRPHGLDSPQYVSRRQSVYSEMTPRGVALLDSLMSIRRGGGTPTVLSSGPKRKRGSLSPESVLH